MNARGLLSRLGTNTRRSDPSASIAEHLRALLNTRAGESPTCPTFGLVDFNDVVHSFPEGIRKIQQSIREAITTHEPRLANVTVRHLPSMDDLTLHFEITGRLSADRARVVTLKTRVDAAGHFSEAL